MNVGDYSSSLKIGYSADYLKQSVKAGANNKESEPSIATSDDELNHKDENRIEELKTTDSHVRAHEAAHLAAAGGLAKSGASFTYTKGPDGKLYATGGEVSIDTSKADTPEATIQKMARVRSAALAPSDPSGQDRSVAAKASQISAQAAQELAAYNRQGQASPQNHSLGKHLNKSV